MKHIFLFNFICVFAVSSVCQSQWDLVKAPELLGTYTFDELIFKLSRELHFDFSAEVSVFESNATFRMGESNQSLKSILDNACKHFDKSYKWKGNHLFLYNSLNSNINIKRKIKGAIFDSETGIRIEGVILKDEISGLTASTNADGTFEFCLENPFQPIVLDFNKLGYQSEKLKLKKGEDLILRIFLVPEGISKYNETGMLRIDPRQADLKVFLQTGEPLNVKIDSVPLFESDLIWKYLIPAFTKHRIAEDSTLKRSVFQAGLWPGMGTSASNDSRTIVSGLAMDVLVGLNAGVSGVSISGLANVSRFGATGAQFCGAGNLNGGSMQGLQISGLYNSTLKGLKGLQIAGLVNKSSGNLKGLQMSGIYGISKGNTVGMQLNGLKSSAIGIIRGLQLSGIFNKADSLDGMQLSAINRCGNLRGLQFGVVNIADSTEYGFQIGLVNIVNYGHRFFSIDIDELNFVKAQYESGGKTWYNVVGLGVKNRPNVFWWQVGWGVGRRFRTDKPVEYHLRTMVSALNANSWSSDWNVLLTMNFDARFRLYKDFRLFFGPSINTYIPHRNEGIFSNIPDRWSVGEIQQTSHKVQFWPGIRIGLGF